MELIIWFLIGLVVLLVLMLLGLILAFRVIAKHLTNTIDRERQRNQETLTSLMKEKPTELISLLSKQATLLSVKDPISYQQVQLMDSGSAPSNQATVDNSDHGELQQWIDDNPELTDQEKELYRELNADV